MSTTLSVVVPATDAPATLPRCLAAVGRALDGPDEVIVVDRPADLSPAAARNAGARRAAGDVVVFVDADVEVHRDAFTRIRRALRDDAGLTAVYGSYDDSPGAPGTVSRFRNLLHHHVHQQSGGPAETFWTGLGAIRRAALLEAGGFDEGRFAHASVEDIELGRRLHAAGARIVLDPSILGRHLKAWTLRSMVWTDFARRGVPWVALQVRERRLSSALNLGWRHRCSAAAVLGGLVAALVAPVLVVAAVTALIALNRRFYALLARRLGPVGAITGMALHCLHHLVAVAAVPVGVLAGLGLAGGMPAAEQGAAAAPALSGDQSR